MGKQKNHSFLQVSCLNLIFNRSIISTFVTSFLSCLLLLSYLSCTQSPLLRIPTTLSPKYVPGTTNATVIKSLSEDCAKTYDEAHKINETENRQPVTQVKKKECNIYDGRWVSDEHPMYEPSQCPFLSDEVSCRRNGRPDSQYERWRWEARDCKIPRFNGTDMLERLRGKRLVFIGDSVNRNQWESLACLLYTSIPSNTTYVKPEHWIFRAKDYDFSTEFHPTQFLVDYETKSETERIINLDRVHKSGTRWRGADVMVFNTGHWWNSGRWDILRYKGKTLHNLKTEETLEIAMKTWANWVDRNVDPTKTTVFFRTISPTHFTSPTYFKGKKRWCYNQIEPVKDDSYVLTFPSSITKIIERRIRNMKTPVNYLNITKLSGYRKDAHQSVYTIRQGKMITMEQRKKPEKYADCLHWCVPGVPDTWNQLLYISIALETSPDFLKILPFF